jgi:hypothetical protein
MESLLISAGVVEQLPEYYVQKQHNARKEKAHYAEVMSQAWDAFNERSGSFADEYSTL